VPQPDFERLFPRRNDAESINRHLDDTLWLGRAHSIGHTRLRLNLLAFALTINSLALHRHHADTPPPSASKPRTPARHHSGPTRANKPAPRSHPSRTTSRGRTQTLGPGPLRFGIRNERFSTTNRAGPAPVGPVENPPGLGCRMGRERIRRFWERGPQL
jgi:hypothetical protein